jgi:hypothetical protein
LAGLAALEILTVSHNRIADFAPLAGLTKLFWLFIAYNVKNSDLSPLVGLTVEDTDSKALRRLLNIKYLLTL